MQVSLRDDLPEPKKEMLSLQELEGRIHVKINYSSLDIINTCMRKAHYLLERKLTPKEQSPALIFGIAVHKALETWYTSPLEDRKIPTKAIETAQLIAYGHEEVHNYGPFGEAIKSFSQAHLPLHYMADTEARGLMNGAATLARYFKHYIDQDKELVVLEDSQGPIVERTVTFRIHEDDEVVVDFFGTIDMVVKNYQTGIVCAVDHKTSSTLGKDFYNRIKPNHQYTGYVWGCQEVLGLKTDLFMVNGIQVAKTVHNLARQMTQRTQEDFEELRLAVLYAVGNYIDSYKHHLWPQNSPQPCTMYGGCPFLKICEVPSNLKENIIGAEWDE